MRPTDIEIHIDRYRWSPDDRCILTGNYGALYTVKLRRMWLIFMIWIGAVVQVTIPLERPRSFALVQYLRMLRPYIAFIFLILLPTNFPGISEETSPTLTAIRIVLMVIGFLVPWLAISYLLRHFEPIRLIKLSSDNKVVTVRFSDESTAARAREALQESV